MNQSVGAAAVVTFDRQFIKDHLNEFVEDAVDLIVDAAKPIFKNHAEKGAYLVTNYAKPLCQAQLANLCDPGMKLAIDIAVELLMTKCSMAATKLADPTIDKVLDAAGDCCKKSSKTCSDGCVDSTMTLYERIMQRC